MQNSQAVAQEIIENQLLPLTTANIARLSESRADDAISIFSQGEQERIEELMRRLQFAEQIAQQERARAEQETIRANQEAADRRAAEERARVAEGITQQERARADRAQDEIRVAIEARRTQEIETLEQQQEARAQQLQRELELERQARIRAEQDREAMAVQVRECTASLTQFRAQTQAEIAQLREQFTAMDTVYKNHSHTGVSNGGRNCCDMTCGWQGHSHPVVLGKPINK